MIDKFSSFFFTPIPASTTNRKRMKKKSAEMLLFVYVSSFASESNFPFSLRVIFFFFFFLLLQFLVVWHFIVIQGELPYLIIRISTTAVEDDERQREKKTKCYCHWYLFDEIIKCLFDPVS